MNIELEIARESPIRLFLVKSEEIEEDESIVVVFSIFRKIMKTKNSEWMERAFEQREVY